MQFSRLLSVISNVIQLYSNDGNEMDTSRPVLRNYPNCGELGNDENRECVWDCDWQPIPTQVIEDFGPFSITQFVKSTECLKDCSSVQECLAVYQPVYEALENAGETDGDIFFDTLYLPYYQCLFSAREDSDGNFVDSTNALVYESCLVHVLTRTTNEFPCIDEFILRSENSLDFKRLLFIRYNSCMLSPSHADFKWFGILIN